MGADMSLRLRLFLAFALLLAVLAGLAALGLARLHRQLDAALGATAIEVGHSVVTVLREQAAPGKALHEAHSFEMLHGAAAPTAEADPAAAAGDGGALRRVVRLERSAAPPDIAAALARARQAVDGEVHLRVEQAAGGAPPTLLLSGEGLRHAIPLPRVRLQAAVADYGWRLGWGLAALVLLGLLLAAWLAQRIAAPLQGLAGAARAVAAGQLGAHAPQKGAREVQETIAAFNGMSNRLAQLDAEAARLREQQALAELGEIGRGLAHALRNPLHAVGLAVEELADRADAAAPGAAAGLAATARAQLSRIDGALRSFLALAAGEGAAAAEVELRDSVEDVLLEVSQRSGTAVPVRLREGPGCRLHAVPAELRILLHTLVVNAVEATLAQPTADGAAPADIEVAVDCADGGCRVRVLDRGGGVPETVRARLFSPHVSSKPEGAGMGLYLAQRLTALRYDGAIELLPRTGGGTEAVLRLGHRRAP